MEEKAREHVMDDQTSIGDEQVVESAKEMPAMSRREDSDEPAEIVMRDLLREVELEASLRFGSREMTLGEVLSLGPGDIIELDRRIQDPVELVIGDKIVARGTAVITAGVYGLRITEVSEARKALESVRCLF